MRNWRARGAVLIVTGQFLLLLMAGVAWNVAPNLAAPGVEVGGSTFTGSAGEARLMAAILGLVGLFGALCLANGIHMAATGRRSRAGGAAIFGLFVLFLAIGFAVRRGLV